MLLSGVANRVKACAQVSQSNMLSTHSQTRLGVEHNPCDHQPVYAHSSTWAAWYINRLLVALMLGAAKQRAKLRLAGGRTEAGVFSITLQDLKEILHDQAKNCSLFFPCLFHTAAQTQDRLVYLGFILGGPGAAVNGDSHVLQQPPHIPLPLPPPAPPQILSLVCHM